MLRKGIFLFITIRGLWNYRFNHMRIILFFDLFLNVFLNVRILCFHWRIGINLCSEILIFCSIAVSWLIRCCCIISTLNTAVKVASFHNSRYAYWWSRCSIGWSCYGWARIRWNICNWNVGGSNIGWIIWEGRFLIYIIGR